MITPIRLNQVSEPGEYLVFDGNDEVCARLYIYDPNGEFKWRNTSGGSDVSLCTSDFVVGPIGPI